MCIKALFAALISAAVIGNPGNLRIAPAVVTEVNGEEITVVDRSGESWVFYGTEFRPESAHFLVFDTKGTPGILDDEIINVF